MKKSVVSLALILSFVAPALATASSQPANRADVSVQKIDEINTEISSIRSQLLAAKIKKYTALTVSVTAGVVSAASLWARVANLGEGGLYFSLRRDEFSTGLEAATVISGAASVGSRYYASLKSDEIEAFDAKLESLQKLLLATRAGLEAAE